MIRIFKAKLSRHEFDALNAALQPFIPVFIQSNLKDIERFKRDDREHLSRRVLMDVLDHVKFMLQRLAFRQPSKTISFKLKESEAIALFYILQIVPVQPEDVYTKRIVLICIDELYHFILSPAGPAAIPKIFSIENYYE